MCGGREEELDESGTGLGEGGSMAGVEWERVG